MTKLSEAWERMVPLFGSKFVSSVVYKMEKWRKEIREYYRGYTKCSLRGMREANI